MSSRRNVSRLLHTHRAVGWKRQHSLLLGCCGPCATQGTNFRLITPTQADAPALPALSQTPRSVKSLVFFAGVLLIAAAQMAAQSSPIILEAEKATLGSEYSTAIEASVTYAAPTTNATGTSPGSANRVMTFTVKFPVGGDYELYARVRVGPNGADDDSLFYANGFGPKSPTTDSDWITVNGLYQVGYTAAGDTVLGVGYGDIGVWKWIKLTDYSGGEAPIRFFVDYGTLTQTFQIGAREDGLQIDKIAFGAQGVYYTVANLDQGQPGTLTPPSTYTPPGPALGTGKGKVLGSAYDSQQAASFDKYWNQVTPGNAGKWGSVEYQRDVMVYTDLDDAYHFARSRGFPFKLHTLIWGAQQPPWIASLTADEQLREIEQYFAALTTRYPDVELIDVVNEPLHQPPSNKTSDAGNYLAALGGSGATGWDWVIKAFTMARQYFPRARLLMNDYSITNSNSSTQSYIKIIQLLKDRGLIDGVGLQQHAFETTAPNSTLKTNLDSIAALGLPIYISEMDFDGPTDQVQLDDMTRLFPLFWEHPSVKAVTLWGFRPPTWVKNAYLVLADGTERPAMVWLKNYLQNQPNLPPTVWTQPTSQSSKIGGPVNFNVIAVGGSTFQWMKDGSPIAGATGPALTLSTVQVADAGSYRVSITGPGGTALSDPATLTTSDPTTLRLTNISTRSYVGTGGDVMIAGIIVSGGAPQTLLIRASGPGLAKFGVPNTVSDPVLELHNSSDIIATNDNWGDDPTKKTALLQAFQSTGSFAWDDGSKDAALLVTLQPGGYTAIVSGKNGGTGVALIEAFEVDTANRAARLFNISRVPWSGPALKFKSPVLLFPEALRKKWSSARRVRHSASTESPACWRILSWKFIPATRYSTRTMTGLPDCAPLSRRWAVTIGISVRKTPHS